MWWLLALACTGGAEDTAAAPFHPPDQPGPYAVGVTEKHATVTGLAEPLPVLAWYPTEDADVAEAYAYGGLVPGGAVQDAPAACDEARPVVLFSHGNGGISFQSFFLTERLASHGFVVVAPDHLYNTWTDNDEDALGDLIFRRPLDLAAAWASLVNGWSAPGGPLDGCVNEAAGFFVAGHSFGGFTALVMGGAVLDLSASADWCAEHGGWLCDPLQEGAAATWPGVDAIDLGDPAVRGVVALAPAGYEALVGGLDQEVLPTLVMGGTADEQAPVDTQVQPIFDGLGSQDAALAVLDGADHFAFTNLCDLLPGDDACVDPGIPTEDAHALVDTVVTAWLDVQLGEERAADWLPPDDARVAWTAR